MFFYFLVASLLAFNSVSAHGGACGCSAGIQAGGLAGPAPPPRHTRAAPVPPVADSAVAAGAGAGAAATGTAAALAADAAAGMAGT